MRFGSYSETVNAMRIQDETERWTQELMNASDVEILVQDNDLESFVGLTGRKENP